MAKVHLLNVSPGDCTIIQHNSGRVTVIDICGGNAESGRGSNSTSALSILLETVRSQQNPKGNYRMCEATTNPVEYLKGLGVSEIWRFILSHPDMDHLDGLKRLSEEIPIRHIWTTGVNRPKPDFSNGTKYLEEDWDLYKSMEAGQIVGVKPISVLAGSRFKYANEGDTSDNSHDGLYICAPSQSLLDDPDTTDDINEASLMISYRSSAGKLVFPGDAHDASWQYAVTNHLDDVADAAFLLAPHHGRNSDRSWDFLDISRPRLSWLGCAPAKHLGYDAWSNRSLPHITSNQTGNVVLDLRKEAFDVYIENDVFASNSGYDTSKLNAQGYVYFGTY